jgi:hypothetical protein
MTIVEVKVGGGRSSGSSGARLARPGAEQNDGGDEGESEGPSRSALGCLPDGGVQPLPATHGLITLQTQLTQIDAYQFGNPHAGYPTDLASLAHEVW